MQKEKENHVNILSKNVYVSRKDDEPLQWMYKQNKPDSEDFLLGKRIDKIGDEDEKQEGSHICFKQVVC